MTSENVLLIYKRSTMLWLVYTHKIMNNVYFRFDREFTILLNILLLHKQELIIIVCIEIKKIVSIALSDSLLIR